MNPDTQLARRQFLLGLAGTGTASCLAQQPASRTTGRDGSPMEPKDNAARSANLEAITRYCAAWRAGDMAALLECYHNEFTLHYSGKNPLSGDHAGKAAALAALAEFGRRTRRRLVSIVDCTAGPHRAVVVAREAFERNGSRAELDRVFVYTIKDHKLHECWVYDFDQPLADRFLADGPM